MKTYPMSAADASWFHNDGPSNLAVVMGVTLTKEPLDFDRVRQVYSERLVTFERFRQRVVETGFPLPTPHWQDTCITSACRHRTTRRRWSLWSTTSPAPRSTIPFRCGRPGLSMMWTVAVR